MTTSDTGTRRPMSTEPKKVSRSQRRRAAREEARIARERAKADRVRAKADRQVVAADPESDLTAGSSADVEAGGAPGSWFRSIELPRLNLPKVSLRRSGDDEIDLRGSDVHPRIAGRRDEVRSEENHRRNRVRLVALGIAVVLTAAVAVLFSPLFNMDYLVVEGVEGQPAAEVSEASGLDEGSALFAIDPSAVRAGIEDLGWVAHASVDVRWPDRVEVLVTPHRPVANVAVGRNPPDALATRSGRVFAPEDVEPLLAFSGGLPVIRLADDSGDAGLDEALVALSGFGRVTRSSASELVVEDGELSLLLGSGVAEGARVHVGTAEGMPEKSQAIESVLSGAVEVRCLASLDVSVPARITIERTPGCDLPPAERPEDR